MAMDLANWTARPALVREPMEGQYVRLEPLEQAHADTLFQASSAKGAKDRFRWLPESPPSCTDFNAWFKAALVSTDPLVFAVIDKASGRVEGRQALMRVDTANGVAEVGHIMWGAALQRTRMATEALFLFADHIFGLGYRRFEWKCNDLNAPSKRSAERFGFQHEGVFRQHMVVKGANRDTAWFAMTDRDWQRVKPAYEAWLSPDNFDMDGWQKTPLRF